MEPVIKVPLADTALLLAAHGERRGGADNLGVWRIAKALSSRRFCAEIGVGFISGEPGINAALRRLTARRVAVYPLFMSSGYFSRDRLVQLLDEADDDRRREVICLPPLGLDPGLPAFVTQCALRIAESNGFFPKQSAVILLAHGSRRGSQSREATERIAKKIERSSIFAGVFSAFLEERPHLDEIAKQVPGSAVVMGMFSGEGLHGARDAPRLVAELTRDDVVFAGVLGSAPGIEQLIAGAVTNAFSDRISAIPDWPL
ncbi:MULTISPECIES: CbiX/SirB N-terminal domain-containing protein [unclassified Bradyrhizobium]|uniref:CbiX/SirB N-terminal domain-containing protein n=1 Tax=unclassified Bradyrhizobium TaxID=2631580 RepID=UPI0028ECEA39|nr:MULTISPECIES: CbiX/SirB N-terminal domain-containing protein [unclassified Bradyrhizobium]